MQKKILVVSPRFWPEDVKINDICEELSARGYKVDVLCGQPNFPYGEFFDGYHSFGHRFERYGNIKIYRTFEIKKGAGTSFGIMLNHILTQIARSFKIVSLSKNKYDAVLVYQTSPVMVCGAAARLAKKKKIPLAAYVIDMWPHAICEEMDIQSPTFKKILKNISKRNYALCDRLVTLNDAQSEYLSSKLDIPHFLITTAPQGPCRAAACLSPDTSVHEKYAGSFNIVIPVRYGEKINMQQLLNMGVLLRGRGIRGVRFIIEGPQVQSLKKKILKADLGDMFFTEYTASMNESSPLYEAADAFLICTSGNSTDIYHGPELLTDCMAAGKPILFTGEGRYRNIIKSAGCGWCIDPNDASALADKVTALMKMDDEHIRQTGKKGQEYQRQHFDMQACVDRLEKVLFEQDDLMKENKNTDIFTTSSF